MRDAEIRRALTVLLQAQHAEEPDTVIRQELGLCLGETRVDIAVLNGTLAGYEIKSPRDTLERLPRQVTLYGQVLDQATIVTTGKYAARVLDVVPGWWGLLTVSAHGDKVHVEATRPATDNPTVDPYCVAQLLWRDEAYSLLQRRGLHQGLKKATRFTLWSELAGRLPLPELRDEVREALKVRPLWPGGQ
jgi:hypothetical protein